MTGPRLTPLVQSLPATVPFVGPETLERARGAAFAARLGANENEFGPAPRAVAAMQAAAAEQWMYADPTSHDLRAALAKKHALTPEQIVIGEGIDGLLSYVARMFVSEGTRVVTSDGAYPTFNYHIAGFGGVLDKLPYREDREDLPALLARAEETGAALIYLANPDNPMGTWWTGAEIEAALDAMPEGALLLLDEAYIEFAPEEAVPRIDPEDPRVLRFRTFSKAYGMAGARIGYAMGPRETIAAFEKIRNHFGLNRASQLGALAALEDDAWLADCVERVARARARIVEIGAAHGLVALPSATNFVALDCGRDGDFARRVLAGLLKRGVFARMPFIAPQDRCLRISAGPDSALDLFAAALPEALAAAK